MEPNIEVGLRFAPTPLATTGGTPASSVAPQPTKREFYYKQLSELDITSDYYREIIEMEYVGATTIALGQDVYVSSILRRVKMEQFPN